MNPCKVVEIEAKFYSCMPVVAGPTLAGGSVDWHFTSHHRGGASRRLAAR